MVNQNHIYVVISATPYLLGKTIRGLTREIYNHTSISLDEELTQMYSFARRHFRTPLYGGFVKESSARYHINGKSAQIRLCKIPVTQEQYQAIAQKLAHMYQHKERYIYNHISAVGALIHKTIPAKNAYTCVEFCAEILAQAGMDIDPKKYYSIEDMVKLLEDFVIYTGPMPNNNEEDHAFYTKRPFFSRLWVTVRDVCRIFPRLTK